jgi:hypothetical protein
MIQKFSPYPRGTPIEEIALEFHGCSWSEYVNILIERWKLEIPAGPLPAAATSRIVTGRDGYGMKSNVAYRNNVVRKAEGSS